MAPEGNTSALEMIKVTSVGQTSVQAAATPHPRATTVCSFAGPRYLLYKRALLKISCANWIQYHQQTLFLEDDFSIV
jgi:hypothetical protein